MRIQHSICHIVLNAVGSGLRLPRRFTQTRNPLPETAVYTDLKISPLFYAK